MKTGKHFPNGFNSYIETHFEIAGAIAVDAEKDEPSKLVNLRHEAQGLGGLYELAEELTDEFETIHKGRNWDGEFFDEIEAFIHHKLND